MMPLRTDGRGEQPERTGHREQHQDEKKGHHGVFALWTVNAVRIDAVAVRNHTEKARVQQEAVRIAVEHVTPESIC